ncbi:MAG: Spy/CpxP family protein refolding chaperone [Gammaproteobacteria bacterium]
MSAKAVLLFFAAAAVSGCAGMLPYSGMESREIKALSQKETDEYLSGAGMSFALAAELNGYPGPKHVLEFGDDLALSDAQRETAARLFSEMAGEARALGEQIVGKETELDSLFAEKRADESSLHETVAGISRLKGELRVVHLKYHLRTVPLLNDAQIARYEELRGYGGGHNHAH